jgi:hypothetical protein
MPNSHARLARVAAASRATGRKSSPRADDAHRCQRLRMACRHTPAVRPLRGIRDLEVRSIAHPDLGEAQGPAARTLLPLARAVARGADTVWVLHVGRLEEELAAPRFLWQVAFVAFEISRRHRVHRDLNGWAQRSPCSASRRHAERRAATGSKSASCALVANATGHPGARGLRGSRSHTASSRSKKSR